MRTTGLHVGLHPFKDANLKEQWLAKSWPAFIAVLLAGPVFLIFCRPPPSTAPPRPGYTTSRTVRYGFVVQNTTAQPLKNVRFWIRAPLRQTAAQHCITVNALHPFQGESAGLDFDRFLDAERKQ